MAYRGRVASLPARHGRLRIIMAKDRNPILLNPVLADYDYTLPQVIPQLPTAARVAQPAQRLALDLADVAHQFAPAGTVRWPVEIPCGIGKTRNNASSTTCGNSTKTK